MFQMREILYLQVPPFDPPEAAHGEWIQPVFSLWDLLSWSLELCQTSPEPPWTEALQMRRVRGAFCQRLGPWSPSANPPEKKEISGMPEVVEKTAVMSEIRASHTRETLQVHPMREGLPSEVAALAPRGSSPGNKALQCVRG
uniref:Uncharacterized protein n=1 Tax=Micrurus spixii TaxID=129469 RepID=A0A2D4LIK0_9SAUR